jgi:hypothetical protein
MKRTPLKRGTKTLKRTGFKVNTATPIKKRSKRLLGGNKRKSKSQAKLKKELDAVFSKYIRLTHPARCYTCGLSKRRKNLHCGHFVSRQYLATRWDENNCRPQCVGCNLYGGGKPLDFEENLKKELGNDFVEKIKQSRHQIWKLDNHWYEEKISFYKNLLAQYKDIV